jgi:hypothetical protein
MKITHPIVIWWRAVFGFLMVAAIIYGLVIWGWGYIVRDFEHYGSQTYPWQQHNSTYIVNYSNIHSTTQSNNTTSTDGS